MCNNLSGFHVFYSEGAVPDRLKLTLHKGGDECIIYAPNNYDNDIYERKPIKGEGNGKS